MPGCSCMACRRRGRASLHPVLGQVVAGGPAERAGLAPGDRIARVDGRPIDSWESLVAAVRSRPGTALQLTVERGDTTRTLEVVPDSVSAGEMRVGRIGAAPFIPPSHAEKMLVRVQYGPLESLGKALAKTADIALFSLRMLGKMLLGEVPWRNL